MRHTNKTAFIDIQGINGREAYQISSSTYQDIRNLLKNAKAVKTTDIPFLSAEVVFPELDDPIMGPANYLKGLRFREGLTQKELASHVGCLQHHISEMEKGKRPISKVVAKKLAKALKTDWRRFIA